MIPVPVLEAIKARTTIIDQQQFIVETLRRELEGFVGSTLDVDLAGENWQLDAQRGLLVRREVKPE